jgi:hypothetical protein
VRRHVGLLLSALVVFFTASCWQYAVQPMPLSEAARRPGDSASVAGGLYAGTGMLYSDYTVAVLGEGLFGETRCDRFAATDGVITWEVGRDRLKLVSLLGLGLAQMTDTFWHANRSYWGNPAGVSRRAYPFEMSSGCKIGIGRESALRLTLGTGFCFFVHDSAVDGFLLPLLSADAFFLQDVGPRWTAGAGIGLRGLQLNAVHHMPLSKDLGGNIAANLLYYGWPVRWSSQEPRITRPIALLIGITLGPRTSRGSPSRNQGQAPHSGKLRTPCETLPAHLGNSRLQIVDCRAGTAERPASVCGLQRPNPPTLTSGWLPLASRSRKEQTDDQMGI